MNQPIASPGARIIAKLIDWIIFLLGFLGLLLFVFGQESLGGLLSSAMTALSLYILLYLVLMPFVISLLTSKIGGTLGKILAGLSVVNEKGDFITFWQAFFRNYIAASASSVFFGAGYFWVFVDEQNRAWHDLASGTKVVTRGRLWTAIGVISLALLILASVALTGRTIREVSSFINTYAGTQEYSTYYMENI